MIPRKSTRNNNLKSSQNPSKICVKKFIFSKFTGLQAYSWQLYYQMNSIIGIFRQYFKPPMLPPCIDLSSPHHILKSPPPLSPCSQHLWETLRMPPFLTCFTCFNYSRLKVGMLYYTQYCYKNA